MSTEEMNTINLEEENKVLQGLPEIFSESEKSEATKVSATSEVNDSQCDVTDNQSDDETHDHSSADADKDTDSTNSSDCEEDQKTNVNENEDVTENNLVQYQKSVLFTNDDDEALQITHYVLDGEKRININNFDFSKNDFMNVLSDLDKEYEAKRKDLLFTIIVILFIVSLYVNASLWLSLFMKSYNNLRK